MKNNSCKVCKYCVEFGSRGCARFGGLTVGNCLFCSQGRKLSFVAVEDNAGGLTLYIFNARGEIVYSHSGYEFNQGQLSADIKELLSSDSIAGWEGNELSAENPDGGWNFAMDRMGLGIETVAVSDEKSLTGVTFFPEKMGNNANDEFNNLLT